MRDNWFFSFVYDFDIIVTAIIILIIFSIILIGIHLNKLIKNRRQVSTETNNQQSLNEFTPITTLTAALLASLTLIQLTLSQIQTNQDFLQKQSNMDNHKEFTTLLLDYYNNEKLMKTYYKISYNKFTSIDQLSNNGKNKFNEDEYLLDSLLRTYNVFCNLQNEGILTEQHLKVLEHDFKVIIENQIVYEYIVNHINHYKKNEVKNKIEHFVKYCQDHFDAFNETKEKI